MELLFWTGLIFGFVAGLMLLVIWIGMLGDVVVTRSDVWLLAGQDRAFCFCLVFALGPLGAILYALAVRPSLARIEMTEAGRKATESADWRAAATAA